VTRVREMLAALRGFTRGFLGFAAPALADPKTAREHIQKTNDHQPRCC
jgi:hypothetical protein